MRKSDGAILAIVVAGVGLSYALNRYYFNSSAHVMEMNPETDIDALSAIRHESIMAVFLLASRHPNFLSVEECNDPFWRDVIVAMCNIRDGGDISKIPFLRKSFLGYRDVVQDIAAGRSCVLTPYMITMVNKLSEKL